MSDIIDQINEACVGHPHAKIAWPHRLLHDARDEIARLRGQEIKLDTIADRLTKHIRERGGPAKDADGQPIGTIWPAMIEAAAEIEAMVRGLTTPRPISEYHEDMGDVLWWKFPIVEPPYVGSPNDLGFEVVVTTTVDSFLRKEAEAKRSIHVGGWPGYHTHFTPLPQVAAPKAPETPLYYLSRSPMGQKAHLLTPDRTRTLCSLNMTFAEHNFSPDKEDRPVCKMCLERRKPDTAIACVSLPEVNAP